MRQLGRNLVTGLLVFAAIAGVFAGGYYFGSRRRRARSPPDAFGRLWTVRSLFERSFIGDVPSEQKQAWGAATASWLHTATRTRSLSSRPRREMERDELAGHFGGIGAYLGRDDQGRMVVTVMRDRPAAKAGVQDNDMLLAVDDTGDHAGDDGRRSRRAHPRRRGHDGQADAPPPPCHRPVQHRRQARAHRDAERRVARARSRRRASATPALLFSASERPRSSEPGIEELNKAGVKKLVVDLRGNGGGSSTQRSISPASS